MRPLLFTLCFLNNQTIIYPHNKHRFVEIIGVFAYYFLSRYLHALPYTAVMFIVGFFIGFAVQRTEVNGITISAANWINIEGEVILLVFLPGLLYLDSYNIDIHLFLQSFWQLIAFAFPMVLGGTALTACVAYYLFPYGWSLDLSMTFGAILSATDPVAVAVLLNELGAPPRLKVSVCFYC
jgi:NhaP-type Na+/H+ or K+/H+ antiporter